MKRVDPERTEAAHEGQCEFRSDMGSAAYRSQLAKIVSRHSKDDLNLGPSLHSASCDASQGSTTLKTTALESRFDRELSGISIETVTSDTKQMIRQIDISDLIFFPFL